VWRSLHYLIHASAKEGYSFGLPHSDIDGSKRICRSPSLNAAYHVLHRLLAPRHPSCALCSLTKPIRPYDAPKGIRSRKVVFWFCSFGNAYVSERDSFLSPNSLKLSYYPVCRCQRTVRIKTGAPFLQKARRISLLEIWSESPV
jgi:hypothetical protein